MDERSKADSRSLRAPAKGSGRRSRGITSTTGASVMICARGADEARASLPSSRKLLRPEQQVLAASRRCRRARRDVDASSHERSRISAARYSRQQRRRLRPQWAVSRTSTGTRGFEAIEINLFGAVLLCRAIVAALQARAAYGKIIKLSGGGATAPLPTSAAYAASKAAVVRFTETLALGGRRRSHRRQRHRAGRAGHADARQVLEAGPEKVGAAFYQRMLKQDATGRHAA